MSPLERYWKIYHAPDLTESGCLTQLTYVKTIWDGFPAQQWCEKEILNDWCRDKFGREVAYVQGVAATQNWIVAESDDAEFALHTPIKWGGYCTSTNVVELKIGKNEQIVCSYQYTVEYVKGC